MTARTRPAILVTDGSHLLEGQTAELPLPVGEECAEHWPTGHRPGRRGALGVKSSAGVPGFAHLGLDLESRPPVLFHRLREAVMNQKGPLNCVGTTLLNLWVLPNRWAVPAGQGVLRTPTDQGVF